MKKVFSGIQPTSQIHIGNYIGAVSNWVELQANTDYTNIYCVVDLHAITVFINPEELKDNIIKLVAMLLACGINTKQSLLFLQSSNPYHNELAWLLNCVSRIGWLNRMTQFKAKVGDNYEKSSVGLYTYPNLMAADILLYDTNIVPVGADQKQHIELCRDIAQKFNKDYSKLFTIPEPLINQHQSRIMSLKDPTKKMSKSDSAEYGKISINESDDSIYKKIMKATTDSLTINKDVPLHNRAGFNNLLNIYAFCTKKSPDQLISQYEGQGFSNFKKDLASSLINQIAPIREKYFEILKNQDYLFGILKESGEKAIEISTDRIKQVRKSMGLYNL